MADNVIGLPFLRRFAAGSFLCTLKGIKANKEMNILKQNINRQIAINHSFFVTASTAGLSF